MAGNDFQDYPQILRQFLESVQGNDIESADIDCIERYERLLEEHIVVPFSALLASIVIAPQVEAYLTRARARGSRSRTRYSTRSAEDAGSHTKYEELITLNSQTKIEKLH